MVVSILIAAAAVTGTSAKMASSKKYEAKVKAMNREETFEFLAIGDVSYSYTRPVRGTDVNEPLYSSIAYAKQGMEGDGQGRLLAVVRKPNGTVNLVLLKRPSRKNRRVNMNNPLNSCSVDPNLKTNQGDIVDARTLKVTKKNKTTFQLEDTNVRALQTHRKVLEVRVLNTTAMITCKAPKGNSFDGKIMCNLLDLLAKKGQIPKDFPSMSSRDPTAKSEAAMLGDLLDDADDDSDEISATSKREDSSATDSDATELASSSSSPSPSSSDLPAPYVPEGNGGDIATTTTAEYSNEAVPVITATATAIPVAVAVAVATPVEEES